MVESARLEIVYVLKGASRVRIPLSPPLLKKFGKVRKEYKLNLSGPKGSSRSSGCLVCTFPFFVKVNLNWFVLFKC